MNEQLIYVVMQHASGNIVMTNKAFDSLPKAKAYAKARNMALGIHSEYYVEKCYMESKSEKKS
jgi:hypothetical protein